MNDSSKLCLSCGLCCDGTLIGFVQLGSEELPALREIMEIEEANGGGLFLQPCKKYCDGCTIYSSRPKQCGLFKCGLLKSFEQKELDFDMAAEIIKEVKQKKIAIEKKVALLAFDLKSPSFYFRMVELKNVLQKTRTDSGFTLKHQELLSDINDLNTLLSNKFDVTLN